MAQRNLVYVLDDDPDMLTGIERLLKVYGFRPKLFQSAEAFFANPEEEEAVCLVLDVQLNGVSGIDVKRRLMHSGAGLPVIFITGNDSETTRRRIEEVGCAAYLPKPFSAQELLAIVHQTIASKPLDPA